MNLKIILFFAGSLLLIFVSRRSLLKPNSHGFPRFFAWEAMLALFLLNVDYWFLDKFGWRQMISWTLLFLSLYLVAESLILIIAGKPRQTRDDNVLMGFEKTTKLVTRRIYRFIRHPMYTSLICLTWGAFFKNIGLVSASLTLFASILLVFCALREEQENLAYFGEEYRKYMKVSKRFIPFII